MIRLVISPDKEFRLKFDTTEIERFYRLRNAICT